MNIPADIARAQGHHGIKGASHGIKGGRPRMDLTDDERKARRRQRDEATRRRKGVRPRPPAVVKRGAVYWQEKVIEVWGRLPTVEHPITAEEYRAGEARYHAWFQDYWGHSYGWNQPARPRNESKPAGRNDPCPCGSGRKFKKCCGS